MKYKEMAWLKKIFEVFPFERLLWFLGLGPLLPDEFSILEKKSGEKKEQVLISDKNIYSGSEFYVKTITSLFTFGEKVSD